jgi:hypothetical protein
MQPRPGQTGSAGLARNRPQPPKCAASGPQNGRANSSVRHARVVPSTTTTGATTLVLPIQQRKPVWLAVSQATPTLRWHPAHNKPPIAPPSAASPPSLPNQGQTFSVSPGHPPPADARRRCARTCDEREELAGILAAAGQQPADCTVKKATAAVQPKRCRRQYLRRCSAAPRRRSPASAMSPAMALAKRALACWAA